MRGIAIGLGLDESYFREKFTSSPFTPFRLFYYPADKTPREERWGVGQHTGKINNKIIFLKYGIIVIKLKVFISSTTEINALFILLADYPRRQFRHN